MWRLPILALVVYLGLDFADPGMPGALCFDADQSVDAVRVQARAGLPAVVPAARSSERIATKILPLPLDVPRPAALPTTRTLAWSQRPRALLSAPASASPEAH